MIFFWSKVCGLLGKTPYIYPRYQVWGVTDLSFDFRIFHWITTRQVAILSACVDERDNSGFDKLRSSICEMCVIFRKATIALHCTAIHSSDMPQLLTPDGSNMTHNDPG